MAQIVSLQTRSKFGEATHPAPKEAVLDPRSEVAKLALLHDEARETAMLANLLGRTPYAAVALAVATVAVVVAGIGTVPAVQATTWALLMLLAVGAIARAYRVAIAQPFDRGSLREFSYNLNAITVFAGFAWGAGSYLALGDQTSPYLLAVFAAAVPAVVAIALKGRDISLGFLVPVATLSAFAAVLRPLPEGPLAAAFVLIACGIVGGAIFWAERLFLPVSPAAKLADISAA